MSGTVWNVTLMVPFVVLIAHDNGKAQVAFEAETQGKAPCIFSNASSYSTSRAAFANRDGGWILKDYFHVLDCCD